MVFDVICMCNKSRNSCDEKKTKEPFLRTEIGTSTRLTVPPLYAKNGLGQSNPKNLQGGHKKSSFVVTSTPASCPLHTRRHQTNVFWYTNNSL